MFALSLSALAIELFAFFFLHWVTTTKIFAKLCEAMNMIMAC